MLRLLMRLQRNIKAWRNAMRPGDTRMIRFNRSSLILTCLLLATGPLRGDDWPQWRGPNRDSISHETGLLQEWPDDGPPLEWRVEGLGEGIASVSVAGGRIFTMGYIDNEEYLTALDERTGARLWATHIGQAVGESRLMRWLSQRTPTVDDNRVYVLTAHGELLCLQADDGRNLWRRSYPEDFDGRKGSWGYCDYPLVDGGRLICTPGGSSATIVALDKASGKTVWKSAIPDGGPAAYAAVLAAGLGGVPVYVTCLQQGLVGVAADDGRLLWTYGRLGSDQNAYTPLVLENQILCASGRQQAGIALLQLSPAGDGLRLEERYYQPLPLNHFQDSLLRVDQSLYANARTGMICLDWKTGETVWTAPPPPQSTRSTRRLMRAIVAADGRLYVRQSDGVMKLVQSSPEAYVETGSFSIPDHEPSIGATFPVITGGRLYLRDDNRLFCYDVRRNRGAEAPQPPRSIVLSPPSLPDVNADEPRRVPRPVFVPTPQDVVAGMLELAAVDKDDVVVDLGSGDGRIVIAAAGKYGCRAIGYEIDEELVAVSRERVESEELGPLVTIEEQDMYTADLSKVDVVAVYVYSSALEKMKLQFERLRPGARIVSHFFAIPGVEPTEVVELESEETGNTHKILLYEAPLRASEGQNDRKTDG
jgi:outer membrane protein assembly factor BamB/SAM-dependent methyltransferase